MTEQIYNETKFQELILYIAQQSEADPRFGATKLNKLLFYSDFGAYRLLGEPITGATYFRLPAGPAPKQFLDARSALIREEGVTMQRRRYYAGVQERIVPLRTPNTEAFSDEELEIVDQVVDDFWDYNASRISDYSHKEWAWLVTEDYSDIPYSLAWVSVNEPLSQPQVERGRSIAQALGYVT
jgi:hypothetical protein